MTEETPQIVEADRLDALACEIGKFIRFWGFKKIHGRLWTHIFLSETPLDAGILMKRLNVSKALMSLSLNDLLDFQVIKEAGKSSRGTQTYVANPQILDIILAVLQQREKKMLDQILEAQSNLENAESGKLNIEGIDGKRVQALGTMIQQAVSTLEAIINLGSLDLSPWLMLNDVPPTGTDPKGSS